MTENQKSENKIIKNNQKETQPEDNIEFWDEDLAKLFQKLNKYLPEDFPLIELSDEEEMIFKTHNYFMCSIF